MDEMDLIVEEVECKQIEILDESVGNLASEKDNVIEKSSDDILLQKFLESIEMESAFDYLKAAQVTHKSLQYLKEKDLKEALPPLGLRAEFREKLFKWKKTEQLSPSRMSDSPPERNSNSKSNLIEVQHVGVTAKLQSPLKSFMQNYSSATETDNNQTFYQGRDLHHNSNTKYSKFQNDVAVETTDSTITDSSKILYEMKSIPGKGSKKSKKLTLTPSKIEFQLYTKNSKRLKGSSSKSAKTKKKPKRKLFEVDSNKKQNIPYKQKKATIFQRLRQSFGEMQKSSSLKETQQRPEDKMFDNFQQTDLFGNNFQGDQPDIHIGIYPFDHGSVEYLKTHESTQPHLHSLALAQRTTEYATKFWAEFFGSLHIVVAFFITFLLQSYRFVLYSVINTLCVGVLHMTSDYLIKPLLTVLFNGFLRPPLIFCVHIFSAIRDILDPIADSLNNLMKPVATVGRSVRLVHVTYNKKNITKNV